MICIKAALKYTSLSVFRLVSYFFSFFPSLFLLVFFFFIHFFFSFSIFKFLSFILLLALTPHQPSHTSILNGEISW